MSSIVEHGGFLRRLGALLGIVVGLIVGSAHAWAGIAVTPDSILQSGVRLGSFTVDTVIITNSGAPSTVDSVATAAAPAQWIATSLTTLPASVATGNDTVKIEIQFTPLDTTTVFDTLTVHFDGNNLATVPLQGNGGVGDLDLSDSTLAFDSVTVGSSTTDTLWVFNHGTAPLGVLMTVAGGDVSFAATPDSFTVAASDSTPVEVSFAPPTVGLRVDSLRLLTDAATADTLFVGLTGTGVAGLIAALPPDSLLFGDRRVGDSLALPVIVYNAGNTDLIVNPSGGPLGSEFGLAAQPALPDTLRPGIDTIRWEIYFRPTVTGAAVDSLVFVSSDPLRPSFRYYLSGRGVEPDIAVAPDSLSFGNVAVYAADTLGLTLDNLGNGDLLVDSVRFLLGLTEFSLAQPFTDGTVIPPGGGPLSLQVEFAPDSIADSTFRDTLLVYSDDPDEPLVRVPLRGISVTAALQLSRDSIDYGIVFLGASADSTLYVKSEGSDTLRYTSTMTAPLDFVATPAATDVAPGDSQLVVIAYTAVTAGPLSAAWNLTTNVPTQPVVTVALTAAGTSRLAVVDTLTFGQVAAGASSSRAFVLTNLSAVVSDTLRIDSIALPAGVEAIDSPVYPFVIAPAEADTLTLRWAPTTASALDAPLTIHYSEPLVGPRSQIVQLTGAATTTDRTIVRLINYPNPFVPEDQTTILLGLSEEARVTLTIYDLAGHVLAELAVDQVYASGEHEIIWNGQRYDGRSVAYGVYICEVAAVPTAGGDEDREYRKLACGRR